MNPQIRDLTGQTFERLTVLAVGAKRGRKIYWACRCSCGVEKDVHGDHLKAGKVRSCGCLNAEMARAALPTHGGAAQVKADRHPLYSTWCQMKTRCYNERCESYPYYGGRGITVCEAWRNDFARFAEDMGPKPRATDTIDRINADGHYEPDNCRWATKKEQRANRSRRLN